MIGRVGAEALTALRNRLILVRIFYADRYEGAAGSHLAFQRAAPIKISPSR